MANFIKASSPGSSSKNDTTVNPPSQTRKIPSATFYTEEEYRTRISPPIDQIYLPSYYDLDTKWRSVAVAHQGANPLLTASRVMAEKAAAPSKGAADGGHAHAHAPVTAPSSSQKRVEEVLASTASSTRTDTSADSLIAPEQPLLLMPTHFETCVPIRCLVSNIERALHFIPELSYEMVPQECMVRVFFFLHTVRCFREAGIPPNGPFLSLAPAQWNAVYMRGSAHCKLQIHVYRNNSSFIVEANRLTVRGRRRSFDPPRSRCLFDRGARSPPSLPGFVLRG
jgi:hypothetical protein